ncbi:3-hydroxyacyl-CoA dehydrogenase family protein [Nocardia sp. CDC159]|uniref:3-hydroxyacyl-CoA dehydrogenase family protein n=1 Tax=Nocardia pulmonis TaxID=2951408 RepID=A0A9X2EDV2_9NOCA|nr:MULTISPECIES: 3-hydroxyacyl-CoA dehydrogenase family protein [Nocardia]MCM6779027.1 3-hydroxyacyl-CoA dehydrogenase family protein [Nocardia pulmonis]MCM6791917.1 3-hydroxyacyl-CoA dehydrogenase family protein [Nocardia sp. CDC159]
MTDGITVLGAGVMGTGIATLAIGHGIGVHLIDIDPDVVERAPSIVRRKLRHAQLLGSLPADQEFGALTTATTLGGSIDTTAVVEAITERFELKYKVLGEVAAVADERTVLVSNTSSIPIDELATALPRPERLAGIHFMNPAYAVGTFEVIRGTHTSEATMDRVTALLDRLHRRSVVVRDSPGFVTSRLLHPMINAAARIVGEGIASAEDVDALMRGCLGHPTGPLRTADLIGLDNLVDSLNVLAERLRDDGCRPCEVLLEKVRRGELGQKSGTGFYTYEG